MEELVCMLSVGTFEFSTLELLPWIEPWKPKSGVFDFDFIEVWSAASCFDSSVFCYLSHTASTGMCTWQVCSSGGISDVTFGLEVMQRGLNTLDYSNQKSGVNTFSNSLRSRHCTNAQQT